MTSLPLMSLKSNVQGSEMLSEDDEDPLESLLTGMNFRAQRRRSRTFWSSLIFAGMICFTIGFASSYIAFVMIDKINHPSMASSTDADVIASVLLDTVTASNIAEHIRDLSMAHNSITSGNLQQAKYIQQYFTELGFDSVSSIKPSTVLLTYFDHNQQGSNKVGIIDGNGKMLVRGSPVLGVSPLHPGGMPVSTRILARSAVYVNFGRESDFLYLKAQRVLIRDAIVLARVGKVSIFDLIESAFKHGAKGVILFPDPQQYPDAESMNTALTTLLLPSQLGILQARHGNASLPNSPGIDNGVGCVPIQIISASDADHILRHMTSLKSSPNSWKGNLNNSYKYGPGLSSADLQISMVVNMVNIEKIFYNVIAAIKGSHEPDRYVVLANTRETLVEGGLEPSGGTAAMMELARVFSSLRTTKGWQPWRTIVFCSWGSEMAISRLNDEWGFSLESRTVAYLSVDSNAVRGNGGLIVQATPLLARVLFDSSALVPNPDHREKSEGRRTLYDTWAHISNMDEGDQPPVNLARATQDLKMMIFNHGIPSMDFHYGDTNTDNNTVGNGWIDVNHTCHRSIAQLWGILAWNLADRLVLPLDVTQYAKFLNHSISAIAVTYKLAILEHGIPLDHVTEAVNNFMNSTMAIQKKLEIIDKSNNLDVRIMNDLLFRLDRAFLHHSTLDKTSNQLGHIVLAPGAYLDNDQTSGFGILQDLLSDLTSCLDYDRSVCAVDMRSAIISHLSNIVHCLNSATYFLQDPLQPLLVLADF